MVALLGAGQVDTLVFVTFTFVVTSVVPGIVPATAVTVLDPTVVVTVVVRPLLLLVVVLIGVTTTPIAGGGGLSVFHIMTVLCVMDGVTIGTEVTA